MYSLRETGEELARLLGQEGSVAGSQALFAPLAQIKALHVSEFSMPLWQAALEEHQRRMAPVEQQISSKIRELFGELHMKHVLLIDSCLSLSRQPSSPCTYIAPCACHTGESMEPCHTCTADCLFIRLCTTPFVSCTN